uniref:Inositol-1-monophosphatase n=1 Tax=Amphora coffeiformis TaxID=265554 RepID=A0A7S3LDA3_9STRA
MEAGRKAGTIILQHAQGADVTKNKANARDLLTEIDPLCEKTIQETVLAAFPEHAFLGEEDVPPGRQAAAEALRVKLEASAETWLWIVDPIDGTTNFVHGMPLCMPSIAATYQGQVMVACIYDPHSDSMYTAVRGRGAYCNERPLHVDATTTDLGQAVVAMGSPPGEESMQKSIAAIPHLMPAVRTLRFLGSAALMLAWVAQGRLTAYWEYDLSSWDMAAGSLLIAEAGGNITDLHGQPFTLATRQMAASNGGVHEALLRVLREEAKIV